MVADVIMLQIALISALAARFYSVITFEGTGQYTVQELLATYQGWYLRTALPLTGLCLLIFSAIGFYTRGPYYQNRYKVLVVIQAVSASFVTYAFIVLFFSIYDGDLAFAKIALALAWFFSILLLAGARVWNQVWQRTSDRPLRRGNQKDRHVLVIGGGGYIGSALIPKLLEDGNRVRILDMFMYGKEPLDSVRDHEKLEIVEGDFRNVASVVEALQGIDSVVHLGAIVGDPACSLDEEVTIDINLCATHMIAYEAKRHNVKHFVFASTCSVYGACDEILDERSQVQPVSLYGHTKHASEKVLADLSSPTFSPTILRFGTIYGFSGRTRFDLVVNLLTAKAKLEGVITIHDGDQWRPFVHVEDAARSVQRVLQSPLELGADQIYNVGSNEQNLTILDVGKLIKEQVVGAKIEESTTSNDRRNYRVDFSKIRNQIDFTPDWSIEQGIQQVLEAIASGRITDYRDPHFSNFAFLTREGTEDLARDRWARQLIEDLQGQS